MKKSARAAKRAAPSVPVSTTPNEIQFYRANEKPYGAFSNLSQRPISFENRE